MELPSHCPLFLLPFAEWTRKDGGRTWGPKVQRRLGLITSQFNIIIRMVCSCQGSVPALQACGGMSLTFPPEASLWHIKKKSDSYIDIPWEQGLCLPHTVWPVLRVGPAPKELPLLGEQRDTGAWGFSQSLDTEWDVWRWKSVADLLHHR